MSADEISRRELLERIGAALAFAGLAACTRAPSEKIVPYVAQPPEVTPGRARFYATASVLDGYATGLLVESHEGRPTKVEGNPDHPASLGATSAIEQASVVSLYDPRRAQAVKRRGAASTWTDALAELSRGPWTEANGRGLHFVLAPSSSFAVAELIRAIGARWPEARVWFDAPPTRTNAWEGARIAFGRVLEPRYDVSRADVILALDCDLLARGPAHLRHARDFADRRTPGPRMNRLYEVGPLVTPTGVAADHRLPARAHDVMPIAAALLSALGAPVGLPKRELPHVHWIAALAKDLAAHRGRSLVVAGEDQPPVVHALAYAMNSALGNLGATIAMAPSPILAAGEASHDLARLARALDAGEVDTLVIAGTNVVYGAPADRPMGALVRRARQSAYLGAYEDETAAACTFVLPEAHPLESWGDARAFDGTRSIVQPLIDPLFGGRTVAEVLAPYAGRAGTSAHDLVRATVRDDATWRRALRRGLTDEAPIAPASVDVAWHAVRDAVGRAAMPTHGTEIVFPLDPRVHDGRFAEVSWLLELPAPISKLTWTNAATLAPRTAARLGIATGDVLAIEVGGRRVQAPALIVPGQADECIGLARGWGRGHGTNANLLRSSSSPTMSADVTFAKTGARRDLAITQEFQRRDAIPQDAPHAARRPLPLYQAPAATAPSQWAMVIDLAKCTGCSACVVACQAENNVPVVGESGVLRGRAMHWLRIDTYLAGDENEPEIEQQPMLCQHCEKAPCEYVCPVNATVHSTDGLNEQVYNRCVGTRFCSNNCPYKVRRFNWFDYHREESERESLVHNPDVTVRERGVMEKCTFCVQRIREEESARTREYAEPRAPLQTACQQACASRAIVFGDKADAGSEVARLFTSERSYAELDDLGTMPRVRYLRRVKNPNPELG